MNRLRTTMLLAAMAALFLGVGFVAGGPRGAVVALAAAAAMNLFAFWNADRIVLRLHDAREVDARTCPEMSGLVRDLARRAGLPMPRLYVIDSAHPNAFATGRDPDHAAVALTTGLLGMLTKDEIAAVIAHELGHIRHRDTLVMTMTATIAGAIAMLANVGMMTGRGTRGNIAAMLLAVIVAPVAAAIVQLAISRGREYDADRAAAAISGKPHALASALAKLAAGAAAVPNPVTLRNPAAAALYIVPARDGLFSTHPATANRIAALGDMAGAMRARPPRTGRSALDPLKRSH